MLDKIFTARRGAWEASVMDRNGPSGNHGVCERLRYMVCLTGPKGVNTSWPIRYEHGGIGYDFDPPVRARLAVRACFDYIDTLQFNTTSEAILSE